MNIKEDFDLNQVLNKVKVAAPSKGYDTVRLLSGGRGVVMIDQTGRLHTKIFRSAAFAWSWICSGS